MPQHGSEVQMKSSFHMGTLMRRNCHFQAKNVLNYWKLDRDRRPLFQSMNKRFRYFCQKAEVQAIGVILVKHLRYDILFM